MFGPPPATFNREPGGSRSQQERVDPPGRTTRAAVHLHAPDPGRGRRAVPLPDAGERLPLDPLPLIVKTPSVKTAAVKRRK